jgi:hypothetical protein
MTRFVALVEFRDGDYWISIPGVEKAYRLAKRPEEIIAQARTFLDQETMPVAFGGQLIEGEVPPSLDGALTDPSEPFEGARLVVFDWEPPTGYGLEWQVSRRRDTSSRLSRRHVEASQQAPMRVMLPPSPADVDPLRIRTHA